MKLKVHTIASHVDTRTLAAVQADVLLVGCFEGEVASIASSSDGSLKLLAEVTSGAIATQAQADGFTTNPQYGP